MSYQLVNRSTEISRNFSRQTWAKALELARVSGWEPLGTAAPRTHDPYELNADWSGTYRTNDGQVVKAEDARSLAAALERALDKIPDAGVRLDWDPHRWREDDLPDWLSPEEKEFMEEALQDGLLDTIATDPFDFFAGDEKRHLKEFIRFCRLGSFEIL